MKKKVKYIIAILLIILIGTIGYYLYNFQEKNECCSCGPEIHTVTCCPCK